MGHDVRMELSDFVDGLDFPMYVVTAADGEERSGCLVGFGSQVSLDPPRYLVCVSEENHTHGVALASPHLAVHLLGPDQHALAELFGGTTGDSTDKFTQCEWQPGPDGVPVLDGCPRVLVGSVGQRMSMGDHTGFLLDPVSVVVREGEPGLGFQDVTDVDPGHPA